jgi:hypothetical protein
MNVRHANDGGRGVLPEKTCQSAASGIGELEEG